MAAHVVFLKWSQVDSSGEVFSKDNADIKKMLNSSAELRVIPDSSVPNSSDAPDIKTYLELEEASGFKLGHIDNTIIVTYD